METTSTRVKEGYVVDEPYTWSFFHFQSPPLLTYIARLNGVSARSPDTPFTYCELGCGNGVTSNLLADALPQGEFYAIDFNPEHIVNSQYFSKAGNLANVHFIESSFAKLLTSDLPTFDYITLHGVYSWISEERRQEILQFIDAFLKPGGLVYVSYNALPGWAELLPIWKIFHYYTAHLQTDSLNKARVGLKHLSYLRENHASYFRSPEVTKYVDRLLARDLRYIAHEFCNDFFEPLYFSDVASDMTHIGLDYVGDAKVVNNHTDCVVSHRFKDHLNQAKNFMDHEVRTSFIRNDFFRRDIYCRGANFVSHSQRKELLDELVVGSNALLSDIKTDVTLGRRETSFSGPLYEALIPLLVPGDTSIADICTYPQLKSFPEKDIMFAIHKLIAGGQFQSYAKKASTPAAIPQNRWRLTSSLNRSLLQERLFEDRKVYVGSAVLGSAVRLTMMRGLSLLALDAGSTDDAPNYMMRSLRNFPGCWPSALRKANEATRLEWMKNEFNSFKQRWIPRLWRFGIIEPQS